MGCTNMKYLKECIIINGSGGVGKDTVVEMVSKKYNVRNVSTVDKVNEAGLLLGCLGKSLKDRAFKSDLKLLADKYYTHSLIYVLEEYVKFLDHPDQQIMFIHCREPDNIAEVSESVNCTTLLITNARVPLIDSNMADKNVFNYKYDHIIRNDGTLEELEKKVNFFLELIIW